MNYCTQADTSVRRYWSDCHWWPIEWGIYFTEIKVPCYVAFGSQSYLHDYLWLPCLRASLYRMGPVRIAYSILDHESMGYDLELPTPKTIFLFWRVITLNRGPIRMRKTCACANWRAVKCCEHIVETMANEILAWPLVMPKFANIKA